jgi:hypothetical protein
MLFTTPIPFNKSSSLQFLFRLFTKSPFLNYEVKQKTFFGRYRHLVLSNFCRFLQEKLGHARSLAPSQNVHNNNVFFSSNENVVLYMYKREGQELVFPSEPDFFSNFTKISG